MGKIRRVTKSRATSDPWSIWIAPTSASSTSAQRESRERVIEGAQVGNINANKGKEAYVLPKPGEDAAADNFGFEGGHLTLGGTGKGAIDVLYHVGANNSIAQEFECIVRVMYGCIRTARMVRHGSQ